MNLEERAYWVAWSQVPGVGPILLMRLQRYFESLITAWQAAPSDLCQVEGIGPQTAKSIAHARAQLHPQQILETHERENTHFWTPADPDYPRLLLEIPDPPAVLYYRGTVKREENQGVVPMVALVGTREPSDYGRRWTRRIARVLAKAGFSIVSGLAMGVDAIAHSSCLDVNGRTIAVIGTGVNIVYPWSNRRLAERIAEDGLIISEYPIGTKPAATHFPQRNRIIAALARATLVLEAPLKSGALITARIANEYGRDVYALPGSLDEQRAEGCLRLMSQGAHTILGENHLLEMLGAIPDLHATASGSAEVDVSEPGIARNNVTDRSINSGRLDGVVSQEQLSLRSLSSQSPSPSHASTPSVDLEPPAQKVWDAIAPHTPTSLDVIVQTCQLPTGEVLALLSHLELMGVITQCPGMMYQRD